MLREMCKSKIHRATITHTDLHYEGSLTLDAVLMEAADILENEKVQVVNINNGVRAETYAIKGKRNSGVVCLNGATARCGAPGDLVIIISYALLDDKAAKKNCRPKVVQVDEKNRIVSLKK